MYMVREVMHCKPGKVRELVKKFLALSAFTKKAGYSGLRVYTDVSAERYWTLVAEMEAESLGAFAEMEEAVMAKEEAQAIMAGYHDLVESGRREIYKLEG